MHRSPETVLEEWLQRAISTLRVVIVGLEGQGFDVEELREALTTLEEYFNA